MTVGDTSRSKQQQRIRWNISKSHDHATFGPELSFLCPAREIYNGEWYVSVVGESNTMEAMEFVLSATWTVASTPDTREHGAGRQYLQHNQRQPKCYQLVRGYSLGRCQKWELDRGYARHAFSFDLSAEQIYSEIIIYVVPECGKLRVSISRPDEMGLESPISWSGQGTGKMAFRLNPLDSAFSQGKYHVEICALPGFFGRDQLVIDEELVVSYGRSNGLFHHEDR